MRKRCAASGCGRFVARGEEWCARHQELNDRGPPDSDVPMTDSERCFQERLTAGDYRALFDPAVWSVITTAGADRGLAGENGMLRMVLARLVLEERDPGKLAQHVARIAQVLVQAERTQQTLSGDRAHGLADAMTRILEELGE